MAIDRPRCDGPPKARSTGQSRYLRPAFAARDLAACALFANEAFSSEPEDDGGWTGAQVVLGLGTWCRGSFEVSVSEEELEIVGFPAWRRSVRDGHSDDGPATAYEYVINLSPGAPCESGRWFYGRTEVDDPGSFEVNRAVLDHMMGSLSLSESE